MNSEKTAPFRSSKIKADTQCAPLSWRKACVHTECSLHQIAPYIGKIKSSIARELIHHYSQSGHLVVDPFAGAGTIPLEAAIHGRRVFCADVSPYSRILSRAKLLPPASVEDALELAEHAVREAKKLPTPDLRSIPGWVRHFFHPKTLQDAVQFAEVARKPGNEFIMACFLGILHHQRPGFLSYPSSHLVPYLRDKNYPRSKFPEMYCYRELKPRLLRKIHRTYKRFEKPASSDVIFVQRAVQRVTLPNQFHSVVTSPPYMNALDYARDNRLRLWFIDPTLARYMDDSHTQRRDSFVDAMCSFALKVQKGLQKSGFCVIVVGEDLGRSFNAHPSETVLKIVNEKAPSLKLKTVLTDDIPDVRRTRRRCTGVKTEHFLIFQRL